MNSVKWLLVLTCLLPLTVHRLAHADEYQRGSESQVEETNEVTPDGQEIHKIRTGKLRQRDGSMRVGEIEDDEVTQVQRRQKSLRFNAFGFGPYFSNNVGGGESMYGASLGRHWEVSPRGEILAEGMGAANSHGYLFGAQMGFNFLPMTTSISPVIGSELGLGLGHKEIENGDRETLGNFSIQGNLGLRFFRFADTQMEIMATYTAIIGSADMNVTGLQLRALF